MDSIYIHRIACQTKIGVSAQERATEQVVQVSVELFVDTKKAAKTDDVTNSIDYAKVTDTVSSLALEERKTLERFAEDIADTLLTAYKPSSIKVSIEKKPVDLPNVAGVHVTITRP